MAAIKPEQHLHGIRVYGFKDQDTWLYIGKAKNLSKRLNKHHVAFQTALDCFPKVKLFYCPSNNYHRLERQLIKELKPNWNGGTSVENSSRYPACSNPSCFNQKEQEAVDAAGELL